jgi:hypothetical protein
LTEFDVYRKPITSCHPINTKWLPSTPCCTRLVTFPFQGKISKKKWHTTRKRQSSMYILKPPLTGSCRNIFSNVRSRKSPHCHPSAKKDKTKRAGLTFHPGLSRKISNIMAKHNIQMVPKASGKLSQVLWSPKDELKRTKSGIYKIYSPWSTFDRQDGALTNDSRSIFRWSELRQRKSQA